MPLGLSDDHQALAESVREWARSLGLPALIRAAESEKAPTYGGLWPEIVKQGLHLIAVPESLGGGDGTVLDLAVALEAAAAEMVPGPLLGTAVAATALGVVGAAAPVLDEVASGASLGLASLGSQSQHVTLTSRGSLTGEALSYDGAGATSHLVGAIDEQGEESWWLVPAAAVDAEPVAGLDLSRRVARLRLDVGVDEAEVMRLPEVTSGAVRRLLVTLAAAEAAGLASWCLSTAVAYAQVREQFGRPIGSFQALKHLMAEMAETVEAITASAWDVAASFEGDEAQARFATSVAATHVFDGAVSVAQSCIQVLGGIGFTFEHDAHLYLRRAASLRALVGDSAEAAVALAEQAAAGVRRQLRVDLEGLDDVRTMVFDVVAGIVAAEDRRAALVETGYLMPHWPAPYGIGASAVEQLVIDEELAAAGVERPDLKIGGWAAPTILAHGTDTQRERFLGPTLRGEISWCQLFSEPGAGSDLASLATRATRVEGGWQLTGQKVWTSLAKEADWAICLARTNPEVPKHKGITYFLVDMTSTGIDIRPLREMTGDTLFNEVFLDSLFVPDECVVGEVDGGWTLARTTLSNERVAMASARLDASVERAVSLAANGLSESDRVRVGHAVALATTCAQLGARSTVRRLAGQGPGAESSVAKLLGVRSRQDASELVVELQGRALLSDPEAMAEDLHEMLLTRCLSIAGGTTQVLRNVVAEQILKLPR
ncbi:acyl-CoA dehydrogenase [Nocardioides sp. Kera G14]|uniref:acyl-CoA dehydrogenase n=1 Tax=Nocardioides sp. Kera G14 TaxID=2884264 RepID=UPI001D0F87B2|nr:acyl-CoA dehydrogenase [Nocardioides sp. Kera G14]UDY22295.1 acyl-CoA dehydrogenase [Nocardioides sp. Kera G14]